MLRIHIGRNCVSMLGDIIKRARRDKREILKCINISQVDDKFYLVVTDTHRLLYVTLEQPEPNCPGVYSLVKVDQGMLLLERVEDDSLTYPNWERIAFANDGKELDPGQMELALTICDGDYGIKLTTYIPVCFCMSYLPQYGAWSIYRRKPQSDNSGVDTSVMSHLAVDELNPNVRMIIMPMERET